MLFIRGSQLGLARNAGLTVKVLGAKVDPTLVFSQLNTHIGSTSYLAVAPARVSLA